MLTFLAYNDLQALYGSLCRREERLEGTRVAKIALADGDLAGAGGKRAEERNKWDRRVVEL